MSACRRGAVASRAAGGEPVLCRAGGSVDAAEFRCAENQILGEYALRRKPRIEMRRQVSKRQAFAGRRGVRSEVERRCWRARARPANRMYFREVARGITPEKQGRSLLHGYRAAVVVGRCLPR